MKRSMLSLSVLAIALVVSVVLNITQYIKSLNDFRRADEHFLVQVNSDIRDTYDLLRSFVAGENRSETVLHGITMKFEGLHALLSSNSRLAVYPVHPLDFKSMGRYLYTDGWISGPIFNGTFRGIYHDGVVSDDEIAFLEVLLTHLEYLIDNACLDIRAFNEIFVAFNREWETLPLDLLAEKQR